MINLDIPSQEALKLHSDALVRSVTGAVALSPFIDSNTKGRRIIG